MKNKERERKRENTVRKSNIQGKKRIGKKRYRLGISQHAQQTPIHRFKELYKPQREEIRDTYTQTCDSGTGKNKEKTCTSSKRKPAGLHGGTPGLPAGSDHRPESEECSRKENNCQPRIPYWVHIKTIWNRDKIIISWEISSHMKEHKICH